MGEDKCQLMIDGIPLWQKQVDLINSIGLVHKYISLAQTKNWVPHEFQTVLDSHQLIGPISGITSTLREIKTKGLLCVAVDMPKINRDFLLRLIKIFHQKTDQYHPLESRTL